MYALYLCTFIYNTVKGWLFGCRVKTNSPLMGLRLVGGMPSVEVFLRYPSSYLRQFWRKPLKTSNKRDRELNLAPLRAEPPSYWWGNIVKELYWLDPYDEIKHDIISSLHNI